MNRLEQQERCLCDILLVDNKKVSRDTVQRLLEHERYQVMVAEHGQEAMNILLQPGFTCRLVITETVMPYVNGFDLIKFIKAELAIPVMVLSATGDEQTVSETFRLRADDFMKKPFMDAELLQRVRQLLAFALPVAAGPARPKTKDLTEIARQDQRMKRKKVVHGTTDRIPVRLAS